MDFYDRLLDYFALPAKKIEEQLGLSNGYIYKCKNGKIKDAVKIYNSLKRHGLNLDYFIYGVGSPENLQESKHSPIKTITEDFEGRLIPFLDQSVSAGSGDALLPEDKCDRYIRIPDSENKDLKALVVHGDSMYPTVKDGDIVVCDSEGWKGDGVYVIKNNDFAFVKRVVFQTDGYQVISDNSLYPPYKIPPEDDTVIVGKVYFAVVKM